MEQKVSALLLNARGIQKYIFSSNKLKVNIGANYLVKAAFLEWMHEIIKILEGKNEIHTGQCEIKDIGGGNMLIFVYDDPKFETCKKLVQEWSKKLLLEAPGLKTVVAFGEFDTEKGKFRDSLNALYSKLKDNQNNILPNIDLPYTGLTVECEYTGKVADHKVKVENEERFVSAEAASKLEAAKKDRDLSNKEYLEKINQGVDKFEFLSELEKAGFLEGEQYLSVVHIDGNNMGKKFQNCEYLEAYRELSLWVQELVGKAFSKLLDDILSEYPYKGQYINNGALNLENDALNTKGKNNILPIRPITIGGDDISFICPARLGLIYAKRFMEYMMDKDENGEVKGIHCCAGVAIVPAKYPFFRAYELAEQLCSEAKKDSRTEDSSWLDFLVLHGETYPTLQMLRQQQYVGPGNRDMHYGPYQIGNPKSPRSIEKLFELQGKLSRGHKDSRNKLKGLREVLFKDDHSIKIFLENDEKLSALARSEKPDLEDKPLSGIELWDKKGRDVKVEGKEEVKTLCFESTRYLDAIEIMDFVIPEIVHPKKGGDK